MFLHVEDRGPKHNAAMEGQFAIDSAAAGAETDEIWASPQSGRRRFVPFVETSLLVVDLRIIRKKTKGWIIRVPIECCERSIEHATSAWFLGEKRLIADEPLAARCSIIS